MTSWRKVVPMWTGQARTGSWPASVLLLPRSVFTPNPLVLLNFEA